MIAKLVKELRDKTGAGFLDCKKALVESNHNIEIAMEWLRKKGIAQATKKLGSIATEGIVQTASNQTHAIIFELNSQTDFVAKNSDFQFLASQIQKALLENDFQTVEEARMIKIQGHSVNDLIMAASAKIAEKISLRRAIRIKIKNQTIGSYTHVNNRVAAIVVASGGKSEVIRNVAMHVAAMNPKFLDESLIPQSELTKMRIEIEESPALKGKPNKMRDNIVSGMLRKKLAELTLVNQEFVMEKISVGTYLKQNNAKALQMFRYELGEGIEKSQISFAEEVAKQMKV